MKTYSVVVLLLFLTSICPHSGQTLQDDNGVVWKEFTNFVQKYKKQYDSWQEMKDRFEIFKINLEMIQHHNSQQFSWKMGLNFYSDWTHEEFQQRKTDQRLSKTLLRGERLRENDPDACQPEKPSQGNPVPDSIDWRDHGAVSAVGNQGSCYAGWAFAAASIVEGASVAIRHETLAALSPQQLVDCSRPFGNFGCEVGNLASAFNYVGYEGGLCELSAYPYTGVEAKCASASCSPVSPIVANCNLASDDEEKLKEGVAIQPVGVAIDSTGWQSYSGGIYASSECGTQVDHFVVIVGYGTESATGKDFWIIKNSWGTSWGEGGYIRLLRNVSAQGQCGVAIEPFIVKM